GEKPVGGGAARRQRCTLQASRWRGRVTGLDHHERRPRVPSSAWHRGCSSRAGAILEVRLGCCRAWPSRLRVCVEPSDARGIAVELSKSTRRSRTGGPRWLTRLERHSTRSAARSTRTLRKPRSHRPRPRTTLRIARTSLTTTLALPACAASRQYVTR